MGEVLGIGTTHVPYLMSAPENLLRFRKTLCGLAETLSGCGELGFCKQGAKVRL